MKKRIISFLLAALMFVGAIVIPAAASAPFTDVKDGDWFAEAVEYVFENRLMKGMSDKTFGPDTPMDRSMLVTVLYRAEGEPAVFSASPFTDLKADWYKNSVAWAYENEVVYGTSDVTFSPETPITREQIAAIFFRYAGFCGRDRNATADISSFPDGAKVSDYAKEAVSWAVGEGLIKGSAVGKQTYLDPQGKATRAQIATILKRFLESAPAAVKTLADKIDDMLKTYRCVTHGDINIMFNYAGDSATEENLGKILRSLAGLDDNCTVSIENFESTLRDDYRGAGDGEYIGAKNVKVTFSDPGTGETVMKPISFSIRKVLPSGGAGFPDGALGICPEDRNTDFVMAGLKLEVPANPDERKTYEYDGRFTEADIETFFRDMTGLKDKNKYPFRITGNDLDAIAAGEPFYACFIDTLAPDGRADLIWVRAVLNPVVKTLRERIDEMLEDYCCITHNDINIQFGYTGATVTEENLANILKSIARLDDSCTVEIVDFESELKDGYSGAGDGQYVGSKDVEVIFSDPVTGETETEYINISIRKVLPSGDAGFPNGALGICPEDRNTEFVLAGRKLNAPAILENRKTYEFRGAFTADAIEAFFREMTGLVDAKTYPFHITGNDLKAIAAGEPFYASFIDTLAPDGRADMIWVRAVLDYPLDQMIEDRIEELACVAHNHIYLMFGTSPTLSEESLNQVLTDVFGADAEVTDGYDDIKDDYGPQGAGLSVGGDVDVEFTRGSQTYETSFYLTLIKQPFLTYTGAMETGTPGVCWDDVLEEFKSAINVVDYYDNNPIVLSADQLNVGYVESFLREKTGLTDSFYRFYSGEINDGKVMVCFVYTDPVTGQSYAAGAGIDLTVE